MGRGEERVEENGGSRVRCEEVKLRDGIKRIGGLQLFDT